MGREPIHRQAILPRHGAFKLSELPVEIAEKVNSYILRCGGEDAWNIWTLLKIIREMATGAHRRVLGRNGQPIRQLWHYILLTTLYAGAWQTHVLHITLNQGEHLVNSRRWIAPPHLRHPEPTEPHDSDGDSDDTYMQ